MATKIFTVGISEYDSLAQIAFCEKDALTFAETAQKQLFASQPLVLTNQAATARTLPKKFSAFCADLQDGDTLIFFYAGHGCNFNGGSFLSVYDSDNDDISASWIALDALRLQARKSKAKKILFFIDACQTTSSNQRAKMLDDLEVADAIRIEAEDSYEVVLFSCSKGETALSNSDLGHGVWSYYLIEALLCSEIGKKAINKKYELRVSTLQEYLYLHVRDYYTSKGRTFSQKPRAEIHSGLDPLLNTYPPQIVEKYVAVPEKHLRTISYQTVEIKDVDDLPGFIRRPYNRRHQVPDQYNQRTSSFVQRIGNDLIAEIIEHAKEGLIELFELLPEESIENDGFEYYPPENSGSASFECKYLKFTVTLDLDKNDTSQAIIESELIPYDQDRIYQDREALDSCFTKWFDKMVFTGKNFKMADLYKSLKRHEKTEALPFSLSYFDREQYFEITLKSGRRISFYDNRVEINFKGAENLNVLLESLKEISNTLLMIDANTKLLD